MWNEEQRKVIESKAPIKQVIAAAGSGKTATMIGLLQKAESENLIPPKRTVIVTFTNKATNEFRERLASKGLSKEYQISTFHAFCYRMLKSYHPDYRNTSWSLLSQSEADEFSFRFLEKYKFQIGGIPFPLLFQRDGLLFKMEHPELFQKYTNDFFNFKQRYFKFEFEDLQRVLLRSLNLEEAWTKNIQNNFSSFIVDEFQDTDFTQLNILKLISPNQLTVVGDDWQAIYGFRGATPDPFLKFPNYFPGAEQFQLSTNFRSLAGIIKLSTHALKKNKTKMEKNVKHHREGIASLERIVLDDPKYDRKIAFERFKRNFQVKADSVMLVRSNYRKREWIEVGVPESKIMTIHAAKGLEFQTVILDLSAGWNVSENTPLEQIEEERRILYVGISRAKDKLILLGRKKPKHKSGLEDEFFSHYQFFDEHTNRCLPFRLLW
jgi:DNA helicase-2/ATP-dependent DNA helicase PcrA